VSGSYSTGNLGSSKQYILTCQGDGGTTADNVRVLVQSGTGEVIPEEPPVVDQPTFAEESSDNSEVSETSTQQSTDTNSETPPPSQEIAKVPDNIQPVSPDESLNKKISQTLTKNDSVRPWTIGLFYIVIPATIAGVTIYFILRRRKSSPQNIQQ
jgi:hypothetical protein